MIGRLVAGMIHRSVKKCFRQVYWRGYEAIPQGPIIFATNHHGWHDGYLLYHVVKALDRPSLDWVQEFDSFPLFAKVGGMPFPIDKPEIRAQTIKKTIRLMKTEKRSLMLFCEGVLHRPPELLEFGRSLEVVAKAVQNVSVIPVAIVYDMSIHERPEAFISLGAGVELGPELARRTRLSVKDLIDQTRAKLMVAPEEFDVLARGTLDVNERMDMRKIPGMR